jgi:hypothetical protein
MEPPILFPHVATFEIPLDLMKPSAKPAATPARKINVQWAIA